MSTTEIRKDISTLLEEWKKLDPVVRFLDLITILCVFLFGVAFFIVSAGEVPIIVTNIAFMIFPVIMAGYAYVFRSKLVDPKQDNEDAKKEFFLLSSLTIGLILLSFVYSFFLEI